MRNNSETINCKTEIEFPSEKLPSFDFEIRKLNYKNIKNDFAKNVKEALAHCEELQVILFLDVCAGVRDPAIAIFSNVPPFYFGLK